MINRLISKELDAELSEPEITVLLGPRQVGKTTLLRELERSAGLKGLTTVFYDLEQPSVLAEFNVSDAEIVRRFTEGPSTIFIDEFHYIKNASKIFKAIYDLKKKIKIFASGSSSIEIHKHLKESLAGRRILYRIYPLSFSEVRSSGAGSGLHDYLRWGGMPGVYGAAEESRRQVILSELLNAYILKDIKSLIKEENIRAFNSLLYLLAQFQGSVVSTHSLSREVGLSSKTLNRYFDILEQTYAVFRVPSFSNNLGNELRKSHKAYFYDLGVRNALLRDFRPAPERPDFGAILESLVFLKLQRQLRPDREIRFWRTKTGDEVDFILVQNRQPVPIEAKASLSSLDVPKGMKAFLTRYPDTREAYIVNQAQTGVLKFQSATVRFMSFEDFDENFC